MWWNQTRQLHGDQILLQVITGQKVMLKKLMLLSLGTCCWSTNLDKTKKGKHRIKNRVSRSRDGFRIWMLEFCWARCTFGIMSSECNVSRNIVIFSHIMYVFHVEKMFGSVESLGTILHRCLCWEIEADLGLKRSTFMFSPLNLS